VSERVGTKVLVAVGCSLIGILGVPASTVAGALASPVPTVTASPSTGLLDGEQIQVTGSGFSPGDTVGVAECQAGATSQSDCYLFDTALAQVSATGSFALSFEAARVIQIQPLGGGQGPLVDCAVSGACVLAAQDLATSASAQTPITFDPSVPPPQPLTLAVQFSTGPIEVEANGSFALTGTVTCNQSATVTMNANISQGSTAGAAFLSSPLSCTVAPVNFTVAVRLVRGLPFEPGPAVLQALVNAQSNSPSATGRTSQSVTETLSLVASPADLSARYYLALGDSLAVGFAAPPGHGYADDLLAHYGSVISNLQLVDLGVSGETTTSFINNGQLQAAEAFLAAHQGQVAFVTIDIGGNDIVGCGSLSGTAATTCVQNAFNTIGTNLPGILSGLRQAGGPGLAIYGMNYFDPFLIEWLTGPAGQTAAQNSISSLQQLNSELQSIYTRYGVPTADVADAFASTDFSDLVSSPWGVVPKNVFLVCSWLDVTCRVGGPEGFGDDANAMGYQAIAAAFEQLISLGSSPPSPRPTPVTPATLAITGLDAQVPLVIGVTSVATGCSLMFLARRRLARNWIKRARS
jgi:lysophospholipase L1-like esterase